MTPNTPKTLALACTALLALAACGPQTESEQQAAAPETPAAKPSQLDQALRSAEDAARHAGAAMSEAAGDLIERGRAMAADTHAQAEDQAATGLAAARELGAAALEHTREAAVMTGERAEALIREVRDAIVADRPEVAQGLMDRLSLARNSLSQGVQAELARLQALLDGIAASTPRPTESPSAPGN